MKYLGVNPFGPKEAFTTDRYESYVKIYWSAPLRLRMVGLSFRALQLWNWILYEIKRSDDFLHIDAKRMMEECFIKSPKTFKKAVDELRKEGYIAPCVGHKNVYWINPAIAFKGNRAKAFPKNVVRKPINE
jgi:hypothetical protein